MQAAAGLILKPTVNFAEGWARHGGGAVGKGAMSRHNAHTPAPSRHNAHNAPLKSGETGGGGVARRRVMLVDGVGRGRTAPLPPPSSRQTSMEERSLLHYLYLYYHYLYAVNVHSLAQFGQNFQRYLCVQGERTNRITM